MSIRAPSYRFSNPHQSRDPLSPSGGDLDGHRLGRAPLGVDQQLFSLGHDLLRPGADVLHGLALADAPRAP